MGAPSDVQALENIANEVDESHVKVIFASQCIKAQKFLVDKLRKQAERQKEVCGFISNANLQLEAEIKQGEQEINSMIIAQSTIRSANVDLRKEWLLAKDKNPAIKQRIDIGVKKYEAVWLECKNRYERIPFVQKFLRVTERKQELKADIDNLDSETQKIYDDIKTRRDVCVDLDRKRVVELATFMVEELPKINQIINEKSAEINDLSNQFDDMSKEVNNVGTGVELQVKNDDGKATSTVDNALNSKFGKGIPLIPTLQLADFDFDSIEVDLDLVKNRVTQNTVPIKIDTVITDIEKNIKDHKIDDFIISPYFHKPVHEENFSKRKLINILEDVKIDRQEAYNIISKINPESMQAVNVITAEDEAQKNTEDRGGIDGEEIEVIDMTASNRENIIIPPTQFLDLTIQGSQDRPSKKVSFDLPTATSTPMTNIGADKPAEDEAIHQDQTINSELDVSGENDESFTKIKDMIIKKRNLDLSPQFVYAKNTLPKSIDEVVTSKFFQSDGKSGDVAFEHQIDDKMDTIGPSEVVAVAIVEPGSVPPQPDLAPLEKTPKENDLAMDVDEIVVVSSPKQYEEKEERILDKPISGLLFTHGIKGIPDSLDVSISTTGYDDSDFPHCIDSSLLLSPKADIPMNSENNEIPSQEVPNFLSGLRKTGLSFFGAGPSSESNPDASAQNQGSNFSFNFGGADKKNRGGLFSMFR